MESKLSSGSEFFSSIFGSISGGLSIFSNNPFRRKDEGLDRAVRSGGLQNIPASPWEGRNSYAPSKQEGFNFLGSRSSEENFENVENGELHREIRRFPEMELERTRKRDRKTKDETSTGCVADDPLCGKSSKKKKKTENLIGGSLPSGMGTILENNWKGEPGTPDGSDGIFAARKSKKEKRSHVEGDIIVPRKRQKGNIAGSQQERDMTGFVGRNLDNQGADLGQFIDGRERKSYPSRFPAKRKRENEVEDVYEKKTRSTHFSPTNGRSTENIYEKEDKRNDGKARLQSEVEDLPSNKRKRIENLKSFDDDEKLKRTIFVGNLSLKVKKKAIIKEFSQCGAVESVRLRSVPLIDTRIPRKGAIIKGQINDAVDSQHAYIVFKELSSANAALAHNMKEFNGNHIRVDAAYAPSGVSKGKAPLSYDHTRSIFVGNVPFDVKDEELYQIFSSGQATNMDIEAIRVVRDPQTSLSKGIAFILFRTKAGAIRVLSSKRGLMLRDRILRVSRVQATQIEQKQLRPAKRWRASEDEEIGFQKKRSKLSASYEGTKASKDAKTGKLAPAKLGKRMKIKPREDNSSHPGTSYPNRKRQAIASGKGLDEITKKSSGFKRKRVEKSQRGMSRSKKIRRS